MQPAWNKPTRGGSEALVRACTVHIYTMRVYVHMYVLLFRRGFLHFSAIHYCCVCTVECCLCRCVFILFYSTSYIEWWATRVLWERRCGGSDFTDISWSWCEWCESGKTRSLFSISSHMEWWSSVRCHHCLTTHVCHHTVHWWWLPGVVRLKLFHYWWRLGLFVVTYCYHGDGSDGRHVCTKYHGHTYYL